MALLAAAGGEVAGPGPAMAATGPSVPTAYITHEDIAGGVTPVDLLTGNRGTTIKDTGGPIGVAVTPDGSTAFAWRDAATGQIGYAASFDTGQGLGYHAFTAPQSVPQALTSTPRPWPSPAPPCGPPGKARAPTRRCGTPPAASPYSPQVARQGAAGLSSAPGSKPATPATRRQVTAPNTPAR